MKTFCAIVPAKKNWSGGNLSAKISAMKILYLGTLLVLLALPVAGSSMQQASAAQPFTVEQILGFPSPENLVASPVGSAIPWTFNERGVRNIYVATGPGFEGRRVTAYTEDDGRS
jgi:hypothetical protein